MKKIKQKKSKKFYKTIIVPKMSAARQNYIKRFRRNLIRQANQHFCQTLNDQLQRFPHHYLNEKKLISMTHPPQMNAERVLTKTVTKHTKILAGSILLRMTKSNRKQLISQKQKRTNYQTTRINFDFTNLLNTSELLWKRSDYQRKNEQSMIVYNMKVQQSNFKKQHETRAASADLKTGSSVFNEKYVLAQLIGKGSFGEVYRGVFTLGPKDQETKRFPRFTAIKVENDASKASQIANQITILGAIFKQNRNAQGFPKIYASGIESGHAFMVMDLLGPNLQDLMMLCGGKFSLKTSLLLIIQIFQKVEVLHELGYVYRDIKPQNFLMGVGRKSKELFMVDFGLCKRFRDQNTRLFLPYKESISMVGTIRYSSLNSHLGIDQTRRDDLQSICYMLVYFLKGELPWQGLAFEHKFEKDHMIMDSKLKLTPAQLCAGLPEEIASVFEYIKSLDFYEDPDYRYIISELTYIFEDKCDMIDLEYDWEKLPNDARLDKTNLQISFPTAEANQANSQEEIIEEEDNNSFTNSQSSRLRAQQHEKSALKASTFAAKPKEKVKDNNDTTLI